MGVYQWESSFTHDELVELIKDAGRTYARVRWLLNDSQIETLADSSVIAALDATLELCSDTTRAEAERWKRLIEVEMGLGDV